MFKQLKVKYDTLNCSCGKISIKFPIFRRLFSYCKCQKCFSINNTPLKSTTLVFDPVISGTDKISIPNSNSPLKQVSCQECKQHLYYHDIDINFYFLALDLVENKALYEPDESYNGKNTTCQIELEISDALS